MYKIDIKILEKITKLLDKAGTLSLGMSVKEEKECLKLSQYIKDNYTQIKTN